jgi:hypothetical protein
MALERTGKTSGVAAAATGDGAVKQAGTPGKHTLVETLAKPAKSVAALRAALTSTPALGAELASYFAEGNEDTSLNDLLGRAYAVSAASATDRLGATESGAPVVEKAGTGAGATLPAERSDTKTLAKGEYKWTYKAASTSSAQLIPEFTPDQTKVDAKNVSFAQTVVNQVGAKKI